LEGDAVARAVHREAWNCEGRKLELSEEKWSCRRGS